LQELQSEIVAKEIAIREVQEKRQEATKENKKYKKTIKQKEKVVEELRKKPKETRKRKYGEHDLEAARWIIEERITFLEAFKRNEDIYLPPQEKNGKELGDDKAQQDRRKKAIANFIKRITEIVKKINGD